MLCSFMRLLSSLNTTRHAGSEAGRISFFPEVNTARSDRSLGVIRTRDHIKPLCKSFRVEGGSRKTSIYNILKRNVMFA
ncbi:hypothetical protein EDC15_11845 [Acetobacter aceti NBRC 14818]|nr:hypothetical protein EDC15_11845 [Acetobacter aceti NBRC 14818]